MIDSSDYFMKCLPDTLREAFHPPYNYSILKAYEGNKTEAKMRLSKSVDGEKYRSKEMECVAFYKPISKVDV